MDNQILLRVIDNPNEFALIRDSWSRFLTESQNDNIYLTWEWLYSWWEIYKENRSLFIIVAERNNQLVGLLPLLKKQVNYYGFLKFQHLEFLSTGEDEKEEVCPSFMALAILPGLEAAVSEMFVHFLIGERRQDWDELFLSPLLEDALGTKMFNQYFCQCDEYLCNTSVIGVNAYTDLSVGWDNLLLSFGTKTQKKVRHGKRYIESRESWDYRFLTNKDDFEYFFDSFVKLHKTRWNNDGIFSNNKFYEFQRKVCKYFFKKGWLTLSLMTGDDKIITGNLDYSYEGNVYGYLTAYDPNFKTNLSLGFIGMTHCLEYSAVNGYKVYDWYRYLDAGNYKSHLSLIQRNVVLLSYQKRSLKLMIYRLIKNIHQGLRIPFRIMSKYFRKH